MQKSPDIKYTIVLLFFLCFGGASLYAQYPEVKERVKYLPNFDNKTLHYGYFFGFNNFGYKIEHAPDFLAPNFNREYEGLVRIGGRDLPNIELVKNSGFNVGLIGDLRLHKYFNLRIEPGLYYTQRDLIFPEELSDVLPTEADRLREVKSTYIHLPLLIKFSAERVNNFRPYLLGGVSTSFNLSSNAKNNDDNFNNVFRVKTQTFNYEVGFGIDFYLVYFKFSPSIRGIFSFGNELIPDNPQNGISPWTSNLTGLITQGVVFNLTFE